MAENKTITEAQQQANMKIWLKIAPAIRRHCLRKFGGYAEDVLHDTFLYFVTHNACDVEATCRANALNTANQAFTWDWRARTQSVSVQDAEGEVIRTRVEATCIHDIEGFSASCHSDLSEEMEDKIVLAEVLASATPNVRAAAALMLAGESLVDAAKAVGVHAASLSRSLRNLGRKHGRIEHHCNEELCPA